MVSLDDITLAIAERRLEAERRQATIDRLKAMNTIEGSGEIGADVPLFPRPPGTMMPAPLNPGMGQSNSAAGLREETPQQKRQRVARGMMALAHGRPEAEVDLLRRVDPGGTIEYDAEGRALSTSESLGTNRTFLNAPGFSQRDADQIGVGVAMQTPAGRLAGIPASIGGRAAMGTAVGAGEVAAQQALVHQIAGTPISSTDVALGGAAAGLFELIPPHIMKAVTSYIRSRGDLDASVMAEMKRLGVDPTTLTNEQRAELLALAKVSPENIRRAQGLQMEDEFGIPLTEFGRTGEGARKELYARNRAPGEFEAFDAQQTLAMKEGADLVHRRLSPSGVPVAHTVTEAGREVREGVKWRAARLSDDVDAAFDEFRRSGRAAFAGQPVANLLRSMRGLVQDEFDIAPGLDPGAPMTRRAVQELEREAGNAVNDSAEMTAQSMSLLRRKISNWRKSAKSSDRVAMNRIMREFDKFMDAAIDSHLIRGDTEVIEKLRQANALRTKYGRRFEENTFGKAKDQAGRNVQRIVEEDLSSHEVINLVLGHARLGRKAGSLATLRRIKSAVGENSTEWQALREAAFLQLAKPRTLGFEFSPKHFLRDFNNAIQGEGAEVMAELFDVDERKMLMRFADTVRRTLPDHLQQSAAGGARFEEEIMSAMEKVSRRLAGAAQLRANKGRAMLLGALPDMMNRYVAHVALNGVPPPAPRVSFGSLLTAAGTQSVVHEEN